MKNKKTVLYSLIIMLVAGVIYFPAQAQQKHEPRAVIYPVDVKKSKLFWKAPPLLEPCSYYQYKYIINNKLK